MSLDKFDNRDIVFYDAECGFCDKFILYIARINQNPDLYFSSLENINLLTQDKKLLKLDSIVVKVNKSYLTKSNAILFLLETNIFMKSILFPIRIIPKSIRDFFYDFFSKNRKKIYNNEECRIPSEDIKKRFI